MVRLTLEFLTNLFCRRAHYGRALEDAISEFKTQWPKEWNGANPLGGSKTFNSMSAEERVGAVDLGLRVFAGSQAEADG